jgi:hypothetical protein
MRSKVIHLRADSDGDEEGSSSNKRKISRACELQPSPPSSSFSSFSRAAAQSRVSSDPITRELYAGRLVLHFLSSPSVAWLRLGRRGTTLEFELNLVLTFALEPVH